MGDLIVELLEHDPRNWLSALPDSHSAQCVRRSVAAPGESGIREA